MTQQGWCRRFLVSLRLGFAGVAYFSAISFPRLFLLFCCDRVSAVWEVAGFPSLPGSLFFFPVVLVAPFIVFIVY